MVSISESKCPQCGIDFYPPEETLIEETITDDASFGQATRKFLAIFDFIIGGLLMVFIIISILKIDVWEIKHTQAVIILGLLGTIMLLAGFGVWNGKRWARVIQVLAIIIYGINIVSVRITKDISYFAQGEIMFALGRLIMSFADIFLFSFLAYIAWKKIR